VISISRLLFLLRLHDLVHHQIFKIIMFHTYNIHNDILEFNTERVVFVILDMR